MKHHYFLLRHGESHPNVQGIIVSTPRGGTDPANGLTEKGKSQAVQAGKSLGEQLLAASSSSSSLLNAEKNNVYFHTSDFSRALETATIARDTLKSEFGIDSTLKTEIVLRERNFGVHNNGSNQNYQVVWDQDAIDENHTHGDVESSVSVRKRARQLVDALEETITTPSNIVLVAHGDTLQILQTSFAGIPAGKQRSLPHMTNGEVRKVN